LCLLGVAVTPVVLVVVLLMEPPQGGALSAHQYGRLATFTALLCSFVLYFCRGSWGKKAFWRVFAAFLAVHTLVHLALLPYGDEWMEILTPRRGRSPSDWLLTSMIFEGLGLSSSCDYLGFSAGSRRD
jgi:hypothetical protein